MIESFGINAAKDCIRDAAGSEGEKRSNYL